MLTSYKHSALKRLKELPPHNLREPLTIIRLQEHRHWIVPFGSKIEIALRSTAPTRTNCNVGRLSASILNA